MNGFDLYFFIYLESILQILRACIYEPMYLVSSFILTSKVPTYDIHLYIRVKRCSFQYSS